MPCVTHTGYTHLLRVMSTPSLRYSTVYTLSLTTSAFHRSREFRSQECATTDLWISRMSLHLIVPRVENVVVSCRETAKAYTYAFSSARIAVEADVAVVVASCQVDRVLCASHCVYVIAFAKIRPRSCVTRTRLVHSYSAWLATAVYSSNQPK